MKYKISIQVCKICGYTCVEFWVDPESYRKHEEAHSNVDNKQCEVCKKEFGNLASLRWHFRSVHKGETKHKCSLCKYETIYSNGLEIHYRSVHEKKSQKAPKRKKAFQDTSKLLSCDHCEFTSMFSAQLRVHIKSVHDKIRDVICEICHFATTQNSILVKHMRRKHGKTVKQGK